MSNLYSDAFFAYRYAYLSDTILTEESDFSLESFSNDFMPKLLAFRNDKVPNVRITLAHVLVTHVINKGESMSLVV